MLGKQEPQYPQTGSGRSREQSCRLAERVALRAWLYHSERQVMGRDWQRLGLWVQPSVPLICGHGFYTRLHPPRPGDAVWCLRCNLPSEVGGAAS